MFIVLPLPLGLNASNTLFGVKWTSGQLLPTMGLALPMSSPVTWLTKSMRCHTLNSTLYIHDVFMCLCDKKWGHYTMGFFLMKVKLFIIPVSIKRWWHLIDRYNIFCTFGTILQIVREKIFLRFFFFWSKILQSHWDNFHMQIDLYGHISLPGLHLCNST
jgi:hypothetical protein